MMRPNGMKLWNGVVVCMKGCMCTHRCVCVHNTYAHMVTHTHIHRQTQSQSHIICIHILLYVSTKQAITTE